MKFKGQVKIPELDSPGVPAVIVIEDPQAELFVEGESLGRWSLVDVRAERLIASAFALDLDGDQVTFIADDPIDFAYGGVEQMANVWARYKTMTLPRRMVATTRSRKGTKPSRIDDLRVAIEETLFGPPPSSNLPGLEPRVAAYPTRFDDVEPEPAVPTQPVAEQVEPATAAPEPVPAPVPVPEPVAEVSTPEPDVTTEVAPAPAAATPVVAPEEIFEEPPEPLGPPKVISMGPTVKESIFKDVVPWAKKKSDQPDEREPEASEPQTDEPGAEEPAPVPKKTAAPKRAAAKPKNAPEPDPVQEAPAATSEPAPEPVEHDLAPQPETEAPPSGPAPDVEPGSEEPVPWLDPTVKPEPTTPRHLEPAAMAETSTSEDAPPRYVVDLGAFEEHAETPNGRPRKTPSAPREDRVLEPAMSSSAERGGLMGAVRSAFVRNRESHDHEYVTAPGGMGIVRNICAQCGHISIGVSE